MRLNKDIDEFAYEHEKNVLDAMWFYSDAKPICPFPPRSIWIEITTNCTLKCKFCAHRTMERSGGTMDLDLFKKVIQDINEMLIEFGDKEMTEISLTRWGEPLMQTNLDEYIAVVKEYGLYAYIPTNGTVMNAQKRKLILDSAVDKMNISVDTIEDERHLEVMGIPIHKRMINILSLFKERIEAGRQYPIVEVSMVKYSGYEKEVDLFTRFFDLVGADRTNVGDCFNLFGTIDIDFDPKDKTGPCMNPWYCLGVYFDGRATFCLQDPEGDDTCIGNLKDFSLTELWNNQRAQEIRSAVWEIDEESFPSCQNCNVNVYHRYQLKPFFEAFVDYAQRMKTLDATQIDLPEYLYLTHLQSIKSGAMLSRNRELSLNVIDEVIGRLSDKKERFFDIAQDVVTKYSKSILDE
ncbi:radical SAM protein [Acidobacteriota bacterium]